MAGQPVRREQTGSEPAPGARGYSWPPFAPGHTLSMRSGIWSARKVDPLAAELAAGLLDERPFLARYPETVWAWARAEARCALLSDWIAEHGLVDAEGVPSAPLRYVAQFEKLAIDLRARLGLDPRSELDLVRDSAEAERSAVDLDALRARGRAAMASNGDDAPEVGA